MSHKEFIEYLDDDSELKNKLDLVPDIEKTNYSTEIKIAANKIWCSSQSEKKTRKGAMRKKFLFFCIYHAHRQLGIAVDPKSIARDFVMTPGQISKAISAFSGGATGYNYNRPNIMNPTDLISLYCKKLSFSEGVAEQIISLANEILEKDRKMDGVLSENFPQKIAVGIIFYYTQIYGINIDKNKFASDLELSEATINATIKIIAPIHNSNV